MDTCDTSTLYNLIFLFFNTEKNILNLSRYTSCILRIQIRPFVNLIFRKILLVKSKNVCLSQVVSFLQFFKIPILFWIKLI